MLYNDNLDVTHYKDLTDLGYFIITVILQNVILVYNKKCTFISLETFYIIIDSEIMIYYKISDTLIHESRLRFGTLKYIVRFGDCGGLCLSKFQRFPFIILFVVVVHSGHVVISSVSSPFIVLIFIAGFVSCITVVNTVITIIITI